MSDLQIIDAQVQSLKKGFNGIRDSLDMTDGDTVDQPGRENIGHGNLCQKLNDFNSQVSDTKNKYKKKTENFIDFLENVSTGSSDVDKQIATSLKVDSSSQGAGGGGGSSWGNP